MKAEEFYKDFTDRNNPDINRKGKSTRELLYQMMEEYADHKKLNIGVVSTCTDLKTKNLIRWDTLNTTQ